MSKPNASVAEEPALELEEGKPSGAPSPSTAVARFRAAYQDDPLVALAIDKNLDIEKLKTLYEMRNRERAAEAERAFITAMVEFQKRCSIIERGKLVDYVTKDGVRIRYRHAELKDIQPVIRPICADLGFSYSWSRVKIEGETLCVCTVSHIGGHSRSASFPCPADDHNTKMSDQQRNAAATTFAERYSLVLALGLVTGEPDADGEGPGVGPKITEQQANDLRALVEEVGADKAKVLSYYKVETFETIPASRFHEIVQALEKRRQAKPRGTTA